PDQSEQHLLGQRRPVVGELALLADHGQLTGEALLAQFFGGAQAGKRGADNDDPAISDVTRHRGPPAPRPGWLEPDRPRRPLGRARARARVRAARTSGPPRHAARTPSGRETRIAHSPDSG